MRERRFKHYEKLFSVLGGSSIQVAESYNSEGPHVWLWTVYRVDPEDPDAGSSTVGVQLSLGDAQRLVAQLEHVIEQHWRRL